MNGQRTKKEPIDTYGRSWRFMKQRFNMMVGHTLIVEFKQETEEVYHRKYYKLNRKEQAYSYIVDIFVIYYFILILTLRIM